MRSQLRTAAIGILLMAFLLPLFGGTTTTVVYAEDTSFPTGFRLPFTTAGDTTNFPFGYARVSQGPRCGTYPAEAQSHYTGWHGLGELNTEAIDFSMPTGTPVVAPADGLAYSNVSGEGSKNVQIIHTGTPYKSQFSHLSSFAFTQDAAPVQVTKGQVVGYSGWSGLTGPEKAHLHFAVLTDYSAAQGNVLPLGGKSVPIWGMWGIEWDASNQNTGYPQVSTTRCNTIPNYAATVTFPPKPCGSHWIGETAANEQKFQEAYYTFNRARGWGNSIGCSQNATHNAGETDNGVNYTLRLQDFVKDNDWNVIIHDQVDNAAQAFVLVGNIRDEYFAVNNWWKTLGAPVSDEHGTTTSTYGTSGVVQDFESGQIYSSSNKGTFASYGRVWLFYYNYQNGSRTGSSLGFPIAPVSFAPGVAYQRFEGGTVICGDGQDCIALANQFCNTGQTASMPSGLTFAAVFDRVTGISVAHAQSGCDPNTNPDTIPPSLGVTQLPGTAVNSFKPRVQVTDNASSISWVQFHYKVPGGNFTAVNMSLVNGMWETSLNTLGYNNGQVIEYLFWAQDSAGNAAQISGLYQTTVQNDQAIPTLSVIDLPPAVDNTLAVNVLVEDANPVSWVTMHVRPQGGSFTQVPMTYTGGSWVATYNTSSYNTGQVIEYLFWAQDEPGNAGQISGLYQTTIQDFSLGRGMVSLTFDDGFESAYTEARPVLSQYNFPGVAYVTTGWTGTTGFMTWSQIQALQNTYGWEIGAHSVTHPELPTLSEAAMTDEVANSKQALTDHSLNVTTFATPFGAYNSPTVREIAKRYEAHRGFWDRDNLNVFPHDRYWLQVKSIERDTSLQQVYNWIDRATVRGEWLVLVFHIIADEPDPEEPYATSTADLTAIAQYLNQKQVPVKTVHQVLDEVETKQVNLFPNNQFQSGIAGGWTTSQPSLVTSDSGTHGAYPQAQHSIKFVGGAQAAHLFAPQLPVDSALTYVFKAFANTEALTAGEFGFYVDEYDASGNWISGQWKGAASLNRVREYNFTYVPSSSSVKKASWQFYLTANATGTVYVDGVHLSVKDNALLNSSFEQLENGWVLNWTGDTNYLVVNTQGQGSNGTNSVVFPANPPSNKFLFSGQLPVDPSQTYYWRSYVKSSTAGSEFGFYIDEYDSGGNWISGQWKGNITTAFDGWKQFSYTPSSGSVAKVGLQYYLLAASAQQITLDQVSFSTQGDLEPPTASVVNPPSTVDEVFELRVDADDNYAGVAYVEVVFYLDGEYYDDMYLTYNTTSGLWEVDYPTDYIDDGAVLEYDLWIADNFGNELNLNDETTIQH